MEKSFNLHNGDREGQFYTRKYYTQVTMVVQSNTGNTSAGSSTCAALLLL